VEGLRGQVEARNKALAKSQTDPIAQILDDFAHEPHFELRANGRRLARFSDTISENEIETPREILHVFLSAGPVEELGLKLREALKDMGTPTAPIAYSHAGS
jgi:hypothetical protein